jgi:cell fate (sporulation/competence/biofilm development) regulator YlbF (YheA/YmcA/DUF963 family)
MATTEEVLALARELGKLVARHDASMRYEQVLKGLQEDTDAQRLLNDYNRQATTVGEKEAAGSPIEVQDKHKLAELQGKLIDHPLLRDLQLVQMDYLDLMRRVDEAISADGARPEQAGVAGSPVANPGV